MGLIYCMECRKEVSDKARKCPHCGAPIARANLPWAPAASGSGRGGALRTALKFVLFVAVVGGGWWIWQAMTSDTKAPFSAGLTAAFREPRKVADERIALKAGQHVSYPFALETDARVHVRITAVADPVDMMLMSRADAEKFGSAGGDLPGGYSGFPALSSRQVGMLDKTEVVPKGDWSLVLLRPKDASSPKPEAAADVAVTIY